MRCARSLVHHPKTPCPVPRTYLVSILRCSETGFLCWMGILCSTWVSICRATTLRSFFRPLGNASLGCVKDGNEMGAKAALIGLLIYVCSGDFCIEQPASSLLFRHPRLQWLCGKIQACMIHVRSHTLCMCGRVRLFFWQLARRYARFPFGWPTSIAHLQKGRHVGAHARKSRASG